MLDGEKVGTTRANEPDDDHPTWLVVHYQDPGDIDDEGVIDGDGVTTDQAVALVRIHLRACAVFGSTDVMAAHHPQGIKIKAWSCAPHERQVETMLAGSERTC